MKQNNPFDEEGTEDDASTRFSEEFEEFTVDSNSFIEKDESLGISPVITEEEDTEDASDKYKMSEDKLLVEEKTLEVFQQAESTLLWRIEGMYKSNGDLHSRSFLRKNPPIFVMESSTGDIAQFIVTEKLSYSLREAFDQIYRGYFGVSKNRKKIDCLL